MKDIKTILIIGSGPIVIGQGSEFDYSGTAACLALKEQGYEIILINSNPASIMTDKNVADKIYMEPLTLEYVAKIIRKERPDAILPTLGGQTGLNIAVQLNKKGILKECKCKLLGTSEESIEKAENREKFKTICKEIKEPCIESDIAFNKESALKIANRIGYPVILRPAFTLGGTGGGFANNEEELEILAEYALSCSPVSQVLVEKSVKGYKEIEYEVIRDKNDTAIAICNMENLDPVGIHTGDSIVVCPSQTLTNREFHTLRDCALKVIRKLKIEGGCNVQFALDPYSSKYYIIEVNPRVSRSSALASKASGYPIARVSALISVGMTLDEIKLSNTPASFEPTLDYIITKIPRFPFDKFVKASRNLSTQMKSTGEVMGIGRTFEESLLKSIKSLEIGTDHLHLSKFDSLKTKKLLENVKIPTDERIYQIAELIRRKVDADIICNITNIDYFFISRFENIIEMEEKIKNNVFNKAIFLKAKKMGFSDNFIANKWDKNFEEVYDFKIKNDIKPVFKMVDTCSGEFTSSIPYFYSTYENENESEISGKKKIIVLGSGPVRVGQGIEFDYSTVHAILAIKKAGFEAIIINNNPSTVSTDYSISDKLYFEPLTVENIMNVVNHEKPNGVIVSLGGQTSINASSMLKKLGTPIVGTSVQSIKKAENREIFEKLLEKINIPRPKGKTVVNLEDGKKVANKIGYPVLIRPSFVLGGRAMEIVKNEEELLKYLKEAVEIDKKNPILIDKYISGKELDVDAICDGKDVLIAGILEHIEHTGVHSGDSISVYPQFSISEDIKQKIIKYTIKLGLELDIKGPFNIQFIIDKNDDIFVIEVNPRSSRTVPFICKASGVNFAKISTNVQLGNSLKKQGFKTGFFPKTNRWYVKSPVFSFSKIFGADAFLSPEMKSTGEAIGYDKSLNRALYKSLKASGMEAKNYGTVFVTVANSDKAYTLSLVERFYNLGFNIEATKGTSEFLKKNGIKTRCKKKISEGSDEILESLKQGHITYVINTLSGNNKGAHDGFKIRRCAVENGVSILTSLDTVNALLNVLEELTISVSTIDDEISS